MKRMDLHCHTTASDGQYTPEQVVEMAAQKGICALAITDHDTADGLERGANAARSAGICFVPGIEISVKGNKELHILGYGVDTASPVLKQACMEFVRLRKLREDRIFSYLKGKGVSLTQEQVEKHAANGLVARPHFARAMVEAGYVPTTRAAFGQYLATDEFQQIERPKPSPGEGLRIILQSGGVPVLAHPALLKLSERSLEELVSGLVKEGLRGMECYYSTHTPEQTQFYLSLAQRYGLLVTGGSDYHGDRVKPEIELGTGIHGSLHFYDESIVQKLGGITP